MAFAVAALLGWSAFAFGAVYAWAYLPVAAGIVTVAALVLVPSRGRVSFGFPIAGSVAVLVTIAAQLVPVSAAALGLPNEGVRKVLSTLDVGYANGVTAAHSLSVDAAATGF